MIVSGKGAITPFTVLNPETEQVFGLWTITNMEEFMRHSKNRTGLLSMIILTLLLAVVLPTTALGQGRGRGHGRGGIFGNPNNKCGKFVNCHDARDGRWDGRGPRGTRVGNVMRVRRHRNFDNDRFIIRNRRVNRDYWRNRRN
jgi:hypothetical protein